MSTGGARYHCFIGGCMSNLNEIYKSVLEADRAAVVICDPEHVIIYMNPETMKMYDMEDNGK